MELFLVLKSIGGLSRREIETLVESAAASGYSGLVLPRTGDWDSIRSFCHSAGRHSVKLWLRDDTASPSGDFGGEITSVPSLAPKKLALTDKSGSPDLIWEGDGLAVTSMPGGGLWGGDPFSDEATEAFIECSYIDLRRELKRFLGYELTAVVTSVGKCDLPWSEKLIDYISNSQGTDAASLYKKLFAPENIEARKNYDLLAGELFTEIVLRPLGQFCRGLGLGLIVDGEVPAPAAKKWADFSVTFADLTGLTMSDRQRRLLDLIAGGTDRVAVELDLEPTPIEAPWCGRAKRLGELLPGPKAVETGIPQGLKAVYSGDCTLVYNPTEADIAGELDLQTLKARYAADLDGGIYLPLGAVLSFTLAPGGCLLLIGGKEQEAEPLPPYFSCGAIFGEIEIDRELIPKFYDRDENRLPLELKDGCCELEVKYLGENVDIKVMAGDSDYVRLNDRELTGDLTEPGTFPIPTGLLRPGSNALEADGTSLELRGDFYTDGVALIPPAKPALGNVRSCGLARYDGPLIYKTELPEDCGGKHLMPVGSFSYALVKIGHRSQPLLQPPFVLPLYRSEAGRTAEIIIFPPNDRKDVSFGLNTVNIISVKI